jgi:hypothetical protein
MQLGVHRRRDHARGPDTKKKLDIFGTILRDDCDPVAGLEILTQRSSDLEGARTQVRIGKDQPVAEKRGGRDGHRAAD